VADVEQKVIEQHPTASGVHDLRVELDAIEMAVRMAHGRGGRILAVGQPLEAGREFEDAVAMAHPHPHALLFNIPEELASIVQSDDGRPIFPAIRFFDRPSQQGSHQLHAVADAENRTIQVEDSWIQAWGLRIVHAGRTPGEDDAPGLEGSDLGQRQLVWVDFAVDPALPHPSGNQLGGLGAKVQNQDTFVGQMIGRHERVPLTLKLS